MTPRPADETASEPDGIHPPQQDQAQAPQPDLHGLPLTATDDLALELGIGISQFTACQVQDRCLHEARTFTARAVQRWNLHHIRDEAIQVVSELVANALHHGRTQTSTTTQEKHSVWLALAAKGDTLLCVVSDPSRRLPTLHCPPPLAEQGRGLPIVHALSQAWGTTQPDTSGKSVWARVSPHHSS
jgi:anti-sigma regulatory factor (Ser/Thr protein kinase)